MPTRNISLPPELDAFIEKAVEKDEYQDASEAIRDTLKLKALRLHIEAGVEALERGDFADIEEANLDGYLEGLMAAPESGPR
jgi:antitoxin ParD1/3/4